MVRRAFLPIAAVALGALASPVLGQVRNIPLHADQSFPEGIAVSGGYIFSGSALDGIVTRTRIRDGKASVLVPANTLLPPAQDIFPRMLGMKVDRYKRLWIAGGKTGKIFVVDSRSGRLIKEMAVPGTGSTLNDLVIVGDAAYVTDTTKPHLWRVPLGARTVGDPAAWIDFAGTPIEYATGPNVNGIAAAADGSALLAIQMNKGILFRIGLQDKAIERVDLGSEEVRGGDGLVVEGTRLYLVRQPAAEIVTIDLAADARRGTVVHRFSSPDLQWPATAARSGNDLLVVNSQFNKRATSSATRPFTVSAVPIGGLQAK